MKSCRWILCSGKVNESNHPNVHGILRLPKECFSGKFTFFFFFFLALVLKVFFVYSSCFYYDCLFAWQTTETIWIYCISFYVMHHRRIGKGSSTGYLVVFVSKNLLGFNDLCLGIFLMYLSFEFLNHCAYFFYAQNYNRSVMAIFYLSFAHSFLLIFGMFYGINDEKIEIMVTTENWKGSWGIFRNIWKYTMLPNRPLAKIIVDRTILVGRRSLEPKIVVQF